MSKTHFATKQPSDKGIYPELGTPLCGRVPSWADRTTDAESVTCRTCIKKLRALDPRERDALISESVDGGDATVSEAFDPTKVQRFRKAQSCTGCAASEIVVKASDFDHIAALYRTALNDIDTLTAALRTIKSEVGHARRTVGQTESLASEALSKVIGGAEA